MAGSILADYMAWQGQVKSAVTEILATDIAEEAESMLKVEAFNTVYGSYSPQFLSRRYGAGGIADVNNMTSTASGDTLTVRSEVGLQNLWGGNDGSNLAEIVESGAGAYHMPFPRHYHSAAEQRLQSEGTAERLLESGLKSLGL